MPLKILFHILPLVLISCSQLSKEECQKSRLEIQAAQNGAAGTANRYHRIEKKCKGNAQLKEAYKSFYTSGLLKFCSFQRGQEQASLGLEQESACSVSSAYKNGYFKELESICDVEKAKGDARKLLNSDNRLCLLVPKYNETYILQLKKQCSYKKGYSIGIVKKDVDQNCKDSTTLKDFKRGYAAGLSKAYQIENKNLHKEADKLQDQRKPLQIKIEQKNSPEEVQKNKIDLNVLESKILELEHQIEKNKRFIN